MKQLIPVAIVGAAVMMTPVAASAQQLPGAVIAVVDSDRIFAECTACVAAQAQLNAQRQQLQTRAQQLSTPLETEAQAIQAAVAAANNQPDAALQQRIQTFQQRQQAAQAEIGQGQQTLQRNVAYVRQQIAQRLNPIITQQMQARGANVALDTGVTYAHAPQISITDAVMAALNQQLPSVSVTAPPPQQQPDQSQPEGR